MYEYDANYDSWGAALSLRCCCALFVEKEECDLGLDALRIDMAVKEYRRCLGWYIPELIPQKSSTIAARP